MDRRIHVVQDIPMESESEPENIDFIEQKLDPRVGSKVFDYLNFSGWRVQGAV